LGLGGQKRRCSFTPVSGIIKGMNITIDGMHCQACVNRVQKALEGVAGARPEKVEVGSAVVAVDPGREQAVLDAVRKAGYTPHPADNN